MVPKLRARKKKKRKKYQIVAALPGIASASMSSPFYLPLFFFPSFSIPQKTAGP